MYLEGWKTCPTPSIKKSGREALIKGSCPQGLFRKVTHHPYKITPQVFPHGESIQCPFCLFLILRDYVRSGCSWLVCCCVGVVRGSVYLLRPQESMEQS